MKRNSYTRRAWPLAAALSMVLGYWATASVASETVTVNDFDKGLDFTYVGWKDQVKAADSSLQLKGMKCNGGGGVNLPGTGIDLSAQADFTPAFKLKVNSANTCKGLYLTFSDGKGHSGRWTFNLPQAGSDFVIVMPKGSMPLSAPHKKEDKNNPDKPGSLDLAAIKQYQMGGDWSKNRLDVEIDAIVLVTPNDKMKSDRQAYAKVMAEEAAKETKRKAEAKAKLEKKRQQMIRSYSYSGERSPKVVNVSLVAPDMLSMVVESHWIIPCTVKKYVPQPGDEKKIEKWKDGGYNDGIKRAKLIRNGRFVGMLQGRKLDYLTTGEQADGDPFLYFLAEDPSIYTVVSTDDPAYAQGVKPVAVYRKTKPMNAQLPGGTWPARHRMYLKMPKPILAGKTYTIKSEKINLKNPNPTIKVDYTKLLSESVHVNQVGYRPDDPVKRAFLSVWLGTGGAYTFPEGMTFSVIDDATGKSVYTGKVECALKVDGKESLWTKPPKNYQNTAVYKMDFSDLKTPGTYRVCVDGVGSSYPFPINEKTWEKAFYTQMKGLYNNRSGVELGPPYTTFKKPRDFHPDDGVLVTRATFDVLERGQYNMTALPDTDTGEVVENAWGGYHDAGDWNPRRVTHMLTTMAQLELVEILPEYFNKLELNIPKTDGIPDMITEALFEIDCFRRIQHKDGAVPYGIESQRDPGFGELSWLSTQHLYVLAPNIRASFIYAGVAGRAAKVLRPINSELAKVYEESAKKAFAWGEADYQKKVKAGTLGKVKSLWQAQDARNLSALVLYDITGDRKYHDVFMDSTCLKNPGEEMCAWDVHMQTPAAFLYARLDDAKADPVIKKNARAAIIRLADFSMDYAAGNAYNITCREKGRPMFAGFFSVSGGIEVARAHFLTGDKKYLKGAVQSCQFSLGCNPNNIVYTTGLGANPIKNPLNLDGRSSGQSAPIGLTVFGNTDYWNHRGSFWDINLQFANRPEHMCPNAYEWPLTEAYFDVWLLVSANEYVIDTWEQNVFVWGYLAARK